MVIFLQCNIRTLEMHHNFDSEKGLFIPLTHFFSTPLKKVKRFFWHMFSLDFAV